MRFPLLVTFVLVFAGSAVGQVRRPQQQAPKEQATTAAIALKAGGDTYDFSGPAVCQHMPSGSIYGTPAERWTVTHDGGQKNLLLTVWRPLKGGDTMITLHLASAGASCACCSSAR